MVACVVGLVEAPRGETRLAKRSRPLLDNRATFLGKVFVTHEDYDQGIAYSFWGSQDTLSEARR